MDSLSNMFLCVYWVGMYLYVFVDGLLMFGKSREPNSLRLPISAKAAFRLFFACLHLIFPCPLPQPPNTQYVNTDLPIDCCRCEEKGGKRIFIFGLIL